MNGSNELLILVILCTMGLLAFVKPILLYRSIRNGGQGVSPLNLFIMGTIYVALSIAILIMYYAKNHASVVFSSVLLILGLWNIFFGILIRRLGPQTDEEDEEQETKKKDETELKP